MANYRGFFKSLDCIPYQVDIIGDASSTAFTEVHLSGNQPFVVRYNTPSTIFEPKVISTATISVVNDGYLQDVYSPYAQGAKVILYDILDESDPAIAWCGYLKPQTYSQGYENCLETIELEASDCLASLQYMDYHTVGEKRQIVTFKDIITMACDEAGQIKGFYWPRTKKLGNTVLLPEHLKISEQNFYTSDSDEPWKIDEVLEEICKYLGLTVLQWNEMFYFIDYQSFHSTEDLYVSRYHKSNNYASHTEIHLLGAKTIGADTYRGSSNSISFEPIYNKATVKDNFYFPEYFIPDVFDEDDLTNRYGGTVIKEIPVVSDNIDIKKHGFTGDTRYAPVYYTSDPGWLETDNRRYDAQDNLYRYYNRMYDNKNYQSLYYDKTNKTLVTLSEAQKAATGVTRDYIGGTIVDYGSEPILDTGATNYEISSSLNLSKYILLGRHNAQWRDEPWTEFNKENYAAFPTVFKLVDGYVNPFITDSANTYVAIYFDGTFERYRDRNYINPDWEIEQGKILTGQGTINNRPFLMMYFGIGNKWWNGTEWTTTKTPFPVSLQSNEIEYTVLSGIFGHEKKVRPGDNWNDKKPVLNNIPWSDWTGLKGYKIVLGGEIDLNEPIHFELIPQPWINHINGGGPKANSAGEQDNWCWISDFSIKIGNKQDEEQKDSDVVYGGEDSGVIDENSVNELQEITLKITTFPGKGKISYSTVGNALTNSFLTSVTETYQSNVPRKPEENLIERYINQYSTQTIKEQLVQDMYCYPFIKYYDAYWQGKKFVWNGCEIDYRDSKQTLNIIEIK